MKHPNMLKLSGILFFLLFFSFLFENYRTVSPNYIYYYYSTTTNSTTTVLLLHYYYYYYHFCFLYI